MHVRKSPGNDQGMCEFEVLESRITEVGDQLYTPDGGLHASSMRAWRRTLFTLVASRSRYFPISRVSLAAPGKISISRSMIVAARDRGSFSPVRRVLFAGRRRSACAPVLQPFEFSSGKVSVKISFPKICFIPEDLYLFIYFIIVYIYLFIFLVFYF